MSAPDRRPLVGENAPDIGEFDVAWGDSRIKVTGLNHILGEERLLEEIDSYDHQGLPLVSSVISAGLESRLDGEDGLALQARISLKGPLLDKNWFGVWREHFQGPLDHETMEAAGISETLFSGVLSGEDGTGSEDLVLRDYYEVDGCGFYVGSSKDELVIMNYGRYRHFSVAPGVIHKVPWTVDPQKLAGNEQATFSAFLSLYMRALRAATMTGNGRVSDNLSKDFPVQRTINIAPPVVPERVVALKPEFAIDDVGGLQLAKDDIREVAFALLNPDALEKWGAHAPQGVLLHGGPGTGKTMLAHALAHKIGADFWSVDSSLYGGHLGDAPNRMKNIFHSAADYPGNRLVIFFDEMDGVLGGIEGRDTGGGATAERRSVAAVFKAEMNTLSQRNPNVIVVAAVNDTEDIDPSLIRPGRFDRKIYVPNPDDEGRNQIITLTIGKLINRRGGLYEGLLGGADDPGEAGGKPAEIEDSGIFSDDIDVPAITKSTDGMTGADIAEIFSRITTRKAMEEAATGHAGPIRQADIDAAIQHYRTGQ